jgi:hypothetical protein
MTAADTMNPRQQAAAKFVEACQTPALRDIQVTSEPGARLVVTANIPNVDGIDGAIEINRQPDYDSDRRIVIFHGSQLHWGSMFTDEAPAYREDGTDRVKTYNTAFEAITKVFLAAEEVIDAAVREAEADAAALLSACAAEISSPEKQ